jgi:adenylylsulfate kinase
MTFPGRVVWLSGPPASGKTCLASALVQALRQRNTPVLWLDSDDLRTVLTPTPNYSDEERDWFYRALSHLAARAAAGDVFVVISATAARQIHRDSLRRQVPSLVEIELECPEQIRHARDPKGLYRQAREGKIHGLPGFDLPCESSPRVALRLDTSEHSPEELTQTILAYLLERGMIPMHEGAQTHV